MSCTAGMEASASGSDYDTKVQQHPDAYAGELMRAARSDSRGSNNAPLLQDGDDLFGGTLRRVRGGVDADLCVLRWLVR